MTKHALHTSLESGEFRRASAAQRSDGSDLANSPDWMRVASMVLDEIEQPALLVSREGRVLVANGVLCGMIVGGCQSDAPEGHIRDLFAGHEATEFISTPGGGDHVWLPSGPAFRQRWRLQVRRSAPAHYGDGVSLLVVTKLERSASIMPAALQTRSYVVSSNEETKGILLAVDGGSQGSLGAPAGRCFSVFTGRNQPCEGCPVFQTFEGYATRAVIPPSESDLSFTLIEVDRLGEDELGVRTSRLQHDILGELVTAKIEWLARRGGLSPREREVLDLLYLGRTSRDVALLLDISERTVKFHQANILEKLGADTRVDLVRLLL